MNLEQKKDALIAERERIELELRAINEELENPFYGIEVNAGKDISEFVIYLPNKCQTGSGSKRFAITLTEEQISYMLTEVVKRQAEQGDENAIQMIFNLAVEELEEASKCTCEGEDCNDK